MDKFEELITTQYKKGIGVKNITKKVLELMNDRYEAGVKNTISEAQRFTEKTIVDYCRGGIGE